LEQGDQIGRIFAYCAIVFFEQFSEKYKSSPISRATYFQGINFDKKMGWATFWAIMYQTHLVALNWKKGLDEVGREEPRKIDTWRRSCRPAETWRPFPEAELQPEVRRRQRSRTRVAEVVDKSNLWKKKKLTSWDELFVLKHMTTT
jgi:hypothetical protein